MATTLVPTHAKQPPVVATFCSKGTVEDCRTVHCWITGLDLPWTMSPNEPVSFWHFVIFEINLEGSFDFLASSLPQLGNWAFAEVGATPGPPGQHAG